MGGVRREDSVRIGHPKTIPHSHERIVAEPPSGKSDRLPVHKEALCVNLTHPAQHPADQCSERTGRSVTVGDYTLM